MEFSGIPPQDSWPTGCHGDVHAQMQYEQIDNIVQARNLSAENDLNVSSSGQHDFNLHCVPCVPDGRPVPYACTSNSMPMVQNFDFTTRVLEHPPPYVTTPTVQSSPYTMPPILRPDHSSSAVYAGAAPNQRTVSGAPPRMRFTAASRIPSKDHGSRSSHTRKFRKGKEIGHSPEVSPILHMALEQIFPNVKVDDRMDALVEYHLRNTGRWRDDLFVQSSTSDFPSLPTVGESSPRHDATIDTHMPSLDNVESTTPETGEFDWLFENAVSQTDQNTEKHPNHYDAGLPRSQSTVDQHARTFACPFYQMDPDKWEFQKSCTSAEYKEVRRVKDHIYAKHCLGPYCGRCSTIFETEQQLHAHQQSVTPCPRQELPHEGCTQEQKEQLKSRVGLRKMSEEDKWRQIFRICFPHEEEIPSPYLLSRSQHVRYHLNSYQDALKSALMDSLDNFFRPMSMVWHRGVKEPIKSMLFAKAEEALGIFLDTQPGIGSQQRPPCEKRLPLESRGGQSSMASFDLGSGEQTPNGLRIKLPMRSNKRAASSPLSRST